MCVKLYFELNTYIYFLIKIEVISGKDKRRDLFKTRSRGQEI